VCKAYFSDFIFDEIILPYFNININTKSAQFRYFIQKELPEGSSEINYLV